MDAERFHAFLVRLGLLLGIAPYIMLQLGYLRFDPPGEERSGRAVIPSASGQAVDRGTSVSGETIATVASFDEPGTREGPVARDTQLPLYHLIALSIGARGDLFLTDPSRHRVLRFRPGKGVSVVAGTGVAGYGGDGGPAVRARLNRPGGVAAGDDGVLYVADSRNHRIRRVSADGTIMTIAGSGRSGFGGDGGPATRARLASPRGLALDADGNLYVADSYNRRIRRIDRRGRIATVFVSRRLTEASPDDDPAAPPDRGTPEILAVDRAGHLYLAETNGHRVWRLDRSGTLRAVVASENGDDPDPRSHPLYGPRGLAVDREGRLVIADTLHNRIRRLDRSGELVTVAGSGDEGFGGDGGSAIDARLNYPTGLAVGPSGEIYVADTRNRRIRVLRLSTDPSRRASIRRVDGVRQGVDA